MKLEGTHVMPFIPPLLVSGCVNSHCPVFHFELGVQVSSVLRMKSGLTFLGRGVKLSETAEWGAVAGPHQRRWPGLPDPGLRLASPQLPLGQNTVSLFRFKFQLTSFQVSLLSSRREHYLPLPCELILPVRSSLRSQRSWLGSCRLEGPEYTGLGSVGQQLGV